MTTARVNNAKKASTAWWLYLVRMANGHLYCGVTTDVDRRFAEHCAGGPKGAKALKGKGPLQLAFTYKVGDKSQAMRLEWQLKQWPKARKEALILGQELLPNND